MLRNYAITALRNLVRNKLYAAINIIGLAVGFAAAFLIVLYVRDELNYDTWISGQERVYRVDVHGTPPGHKPVDFSVTSVHVAEQLRLDFPAIDAAAQLALGDAGIRRGDLESSEAIGWADPSFFTVLPLPAIAGDPATALVRPDSVVITRRMARKYFGTDTPLGQTLEFDHQHVMQVTAILEDLPSNTNLTTEIFASSRATFSRISQMEALPPEKVKGDEFVFTFLRLAPGASIATIDRGLADFVARHTPEGGSDANGYSYTYRLVPLAKVHFDTAYPTSRKSTGSTETNAAMLGIAALILVAAGINFINLMTARATRRATEVGVRKATGATVRNLIVQFLGETLIYALIALALATLLVAVLLPAFNAFLQRRISLDTWQSGALIAALLIMAGMLSIAAGAYPALILSSFRPAEVLKSGAIGRRDSGRLREALVILQFAILIGLCLATGVIYRQSAYAMREGLRLGDDQILLVMCEQACTEAFRDQVRTVPGVRGAGYSRLLPLTQGRSSQVVKTRDGLQVGLRYDSVEPGTFELYDLAPLAGRFFDPNRPGDAVSHTDEDHPSNPPVVINETARRQLGYASPADAIGQTLKWSRIDFITQSKIDELPSEIIGVVPDFVMDTIRTKIDPAFFYVDEKTFDILNIKLSGQNIPETVEAVDRLSKQLSSPRPIRRRFLNQVSEDLYRDVTRQSRTLAIFTGVAVFIACLGLLGLASFTAESRTKEIGIRKAMGASKADILRLLLWQFAKPVLWANLIAWPMAGYLMNRWLHGFAYHVDLDPLIFIGASAVALVIALATVAGHALLVARAKPVTALRYE